MKNVKKIFALLLCFAFVFSATQTLETKAAEPVKLIAEGNYRFIQNGTNNCITAPLPVGNLGESLYMEQRAVGFQKQEFSLTFADPSNPNAGYIISPVGDSGVALEAGVTMYGEHYFFLRPIDKSKNTQRFIIQEGAEANTITVKNGSSLFTVKTNSTTGRQYIVGGTREDNQNQLFILEELN